MNRIERATQKPHVSTLKDRREAWERLAFSVSESGHCNGRFVQIKSG